MQHIEKSNVDDLLTVAEFCRYARCSRNTFYKEIREGRLVAKQFGSRVFVARSEYDRWLAAMPPARVTAAGPQVGTGRDFYRGAAA